MKEMKNRGEDPSALLKQDQGTHRW